MGTVTPYETSAGRRYRVRYRTPANRQTDKRGFKTKRDADLFLASVEISKARGDYIDPATSRIRIASLGEEWLNAKRASLKPSSYRALADAWRVYVEPRWGSTLVSAVSHSAVREWIGQLSEGTAVTNRIAHVRTTRLGARPKSATVVIRAHGVLAGILDVAMRDRRIPFNAARGVDNLPRKKPKPRIYLTHVQVDALARAAQEHGTVVLVAAYTGLRWGELTALRVRDVNLVRRRLAVEENAVKVGATIHVGTPKTHEVRSVPYPDFLSEPLAALCAGRSKTELVFGDGVTHFSRPRVSENSRSWFARALTDAGLERLTIHDLRHTAASLAISSGANVKAVQRMLGHASAAMTLDVYADLFDDDLDMVAASLNVARDAAVAHR